MSIANSSFMYKLKSHSSSQPSLLSPHRKGDKLTSRIHFSTPLCIGQVTDEQTLVSDSKGHLFDRFPDSLQGHRNRAMQTGMWGKKSLF